jgi:glycosyltransferase involved in cell wall biosynthesis
MRVLHVIPSVALAHGGPSQAISMFKRACDLQNISMDVVTTDDDGPGKRKRNDDAREFEAGKSGTRYFKMNFEFYKVSIPLAVWLWKNITQYELVHIHALFSFSSTAAALIARLKRVPYVVRPLGTLNHYGLQQRRPVLKNLSLRFLEGPVLFHAAAVHFTSDAEQLEAESLGVPMNSFVLPLAIDFVNAHNRNTLAERFPLLIGKPYIVFMSRIDPKKNIEGLLQALKILKATTQNETRCLIAGSGEDTYVEALKRMAIEYGVSEQLVWTGHLTGEEKGAALINASLFVLPSYSENFGIAAAEAMSAGLACVLSRGVALAEQAGKAEAAIVVDIDPQDIASAIGVLPEDDALRIRMGKQAKNYAERQYSAESMGQGLQKLYDGVVQKTSAGMGHA